MKTLIIQIQPELSPDLDLNNLKELCQEVEYHDVVENAMFTEGDDQGNYLNYHFDTNDEEKLWKIIQEKLFQNENIGKELFLCSIVVCSTEEGWKEYILFHHYNSDILQHKITQDCDG